MRTEYADRFDARPRKGTGSNILGAVKGTLDDSNGAPLVDAVAVAGSHIAELAKQLQLHTGFLAYDTVNPPGQWGRATVEARKVDPVTLDPKHIAGASRLN